MNTFAKGAIVAAAVLVVLVAGYNMLPGGPGGQSTPTPIVTPTPSPTPVPTPQVLGDGPLSAGTVVAHVGPNRSMDATFTVPADWRGFDGSCALPPSDVHVNGMCFLGLDGLFSDPCHWSGLLEHGDVPVGPSVADLATALTEQDDYEATSPIDATLGGYSGKFVDLHLPTDVASCDDGHFFPWAGSIYAQGPDDLWHLWIIDVEGTRIIVVSNYLEGTSPADQAKLQAVVDSIVFTP